MIQFDNVHISRNGKDILSGVSFYIKEGEKVVFRGKSGSGKSTILKTIVGSYKPDKGTIYFQDKPLGRENIAAVRNAVSFIGQEPVLGAETVREALLLPFTFKAHRQSRPSEEKLNEILKVLYLSPKILERKSSQVSGGEKQRIAIARALLIGKTCFLADEITSALDPESKSAVMACLFRPEITLMSVSHDPDWIAKCERVIEVEEGHVKGDVAHGNH
ncbi:MAG: ATP-binding cassette domain-containing protein [Chlorobiales bacterium]|nr:ATP-binding cassette domain-containing protein [Chlorobiales bacterium]